MITTDRMRKLTILIKGIVIMFDQYGRNLNGWDWFSLLIIHRIGFECQSPMHHQRSD